MSRDRGCLRDPRTGDQASRQHEGGPMPEPVRRLEATGLHGRLDIALDFSRDINVIYGRNGSGKTTVLHVLANLLHGALDRFAYLNFREIRMTNYDGNSVSLKRLDSSTRQDDLIEVYSNDQILGAFSAHQTRASQFRTEPTDADAVLNLKPIVDQLPKSPPAYFPAFRNMLEAWLSAAREDYWRRATTRHLETTILDQHYLPRTPIRQRQQTTLLARALFGQFVPEINYPTPLEIEANVTDEVRTAAIEVGERNQEILSEVIIRVFESLFPTGPSQDPPQHIGLQDIRQLLNALDQAQVTDSSPPTLKESVFTRLSHTIPKHMAGEIAEWAPRILAVYKWSLEHQIDIRKRAFEPIERYLDSVNDFLEGKRLVIASTIPSPTEPAIRIRFDDGSYGRVRALSSGERQIVSMLYAARNVSSKSQAVLIDEPEISLHIDWQRMLLSKMTQQLGDHQLIVCTHSPEIGAYYEDYYQEVRAGISSTPDSVLGVDDDIDDQE